MLEEETCKVAKYKEQEKSLGNIKRRLDAQIVTKNRRLRELKNTLEGCC